MVVGAPPTRREGHAERVLWGSRLLMLVGVCGSIVLAVVVLWMSVVDVAMLLADTAAISLVAIALTVPSLVGKGAGGGSSAGER